MSNFIINTSIQISAGDWFLSFFKDFIGTPAILVGLFAMLGAILLRKKTTDIITTFFKTAAGFLIIGGGAGVLVGALSSFQILFNDLFGITGIVPNNDAFAGSFFTTLPQIAQLGSIIMVVAMLLNIMLAATSRFKYIFLSGHVLFYMSVMLAGVMSLSGLDLANAGDYAVALISSSLIMSCYMLLSCAMTKKWVSRITKTDDISIAHTGSISYAMSGLIGDLIYKIKKGKNIKSTEDFKFPKGLQFFRNTFISMAITMLVLFLIVYVPEGIMYNTGIKALPDNPNLAAQISAIFSKDAQINWVVKCILDAFTFAAGVEILLLGVRMVVGELVPSFKGISEKLIKNSKAGLDCPIVFPYAPNAVLIGFISSMVGACIGLGISIGINQATLGTANIIPVILPGVVAQFFLGATSGVFGNSKGGIWGAITGALLNGIIITLVPIIFYVGGWVPNDASLGWGDTDYLLGVIPGLLMLPGSFSAKILVITIPAWIFSSLVIDGLAHTFFNRKSKKNISNINQETLDTKDVKQSLNDVNIEPNENVITNIDKHNSDSKLDDKTIKTVFKDEKPKNTKSTTIKKKSYSKSKS